MDCTHHLIKYGADVNVVDDTGVTPLFVAVMKKKVEAVATLLKSGADVNFIGPKGHTSLRIASFHGDLPTCKLLLQHGADVKTVTECGDTILCGAVRHTLVSAFVMSQSDYVAVTTLHADSKASAGGKCRPVQS